MSGIQLGLAGNVSLCCDMGLVGKYPKYVSKYSKYVTVGSKLQVICKVSSRVDVRICLVSEVTGMSSLSNDTPHRVAHESLQIRRRCKLGEDMAAGIGDAG